MSRFRAAPWQGHLDRLKRIYSYAIRTKDYATRFRTDQPDYYFLPDQDFDWTYSVYGNVQEIHIDDMQEPLGEAVITTTTMDADLNHCLANGKSLTVCLHFVNKTPVDWYSKKQATVETAIYGSEFVAAKTAKEHIMDIGSFPELCITFHLHYIEKICHVSTKCMPCHDLNVMHYICIS